MGRSNVPCDFVGSSVAASSSGSALRPVDAPGALRTMPGGRAAWLWRGTVYISYGGPGGLGVSRPQPWSQDGVGVPGSSERDDLSGFALASANYARSVRDGLAIGAAGESGNLERGMWEVGRVTVVYGRAGGLSSIHAQAWSQRSPGVSGTAEAWDRVGSTITP